MDNKEKKENKADALPLISAERDRGDDKKMAVYGPYRDFIKESWHDHDEAIRLLTANPDIMKYRFQGNGYYDTGKEVEAPVMHPLRAAVLEMKRNGPFDAKFVIRLLDHPSFKALGAETQTDIINGKDQEGYTLLGQAIRYNQPELAVELVRRGARVSDLNPTQEHILVMVGKHAKTQRELDFYARELPALQKSSPKLRDELTAAAKDEKGQMELIMPHWLKKEVRNPPAILNLYLALAPDTEKQIDAWLKSRIGNHMDTRFVGEWTPGLPPGMAWVDKKFGGGQEVRVLDETVYEQGRVDWIRSVCEGAVSADKLICDDKGKPRRDYTTAMAYRLSAIAPHLKPGDMTMPELKAFLAILPRHLPMTPEEAEKLKEFISADRYRAMALMDAMNSAATQGNIALVKELGKFRHYYRPEKFPTANRGYEQQWQFEATSGNALQFAITKQPDTKMLEALLDAGVRDKHVHRYVTWIRNKPELIEPMLRVLKEKGIQLEVLQSVGRPVKDAGGKSIETVTDNPLAWEAVGGENPQIIPVLIQQGLMPGEFQVNGVKKTLLAHTIDRFEWKQEGAELTLDQQAIINQIIGWEQQKAKDAEKGKPLKGEPVGLLPKPSLPTDVPNREPVLAV